MNWVDLFCIIEIYILPKPNTLSVLDGWRHHCDLCIQSEAFYNELYKLDNN